MTVTRTRLGIFCDKMIEAGWLSALIIVPLFFNIYSQRVFEPDKLSLLRSIALMMSACWLIRWIEDHRSGALGEPGGRSLWGRVSTTPLALPTLLLVLVYVISTATSVSWRVSLFGSYQRLQGTYTTLSYVVIFFLVLDGLRTQRQLNRLLTVAVLTSFPVAMYGLIQHFGLDPLPWGGDVTTRVASSMGNAIFVAAFLILVVPLTLSKLFENWRRVVGDFETRDGILGVVAFVLLASALLAGMLVGRSGEASWVRWAALLLGAGLQVPIYLLTAPERRVRVLAISLPLTFAFLVGFSWILEIFFPPGQGMSSERYFWLGVLAAAVFVLAMGAFAFYLRKPLSRLLLLACYFIVLIAQLVAIFYAQSRGPLLGLMGGLLAYFALLGLTKRRVWLPWLMTATAVALAAFLLMFNTVDAPLFERLRETPYVGRLGKVLQTEGGTGKVRVLIWEGVTDMVGWHAPIEYPGDDGGPDALNAARPLIGYGPESMYVAYNRFYPPDLAHYEKRNASPDRSHNETFDALVITGAIGFMVYMFLFTSVFYYGLKWLGLLRQRGEMWAFLGLWILGGLVGAAVAWLWRGPVYVGVGIPGGVMLGFAAYLFLAVLRRTLKPAGEGRASGRYALWLVALVSAAVAHFVEIHFGIAIAATRTYFWLYAAAMVVIGTRLALRPVEEDLSAMQAESVDAENATPRKRRRRAGAGQSSLPEKRIKDLDWLGSILVWSLLTVLVLCTLLFDSIVVPLDDPGILDTIWQSLALNRGEPSYVMLVLILGTWAMMGLVSLSNLATRLNSASKGPRDWLAAVGTFSLVTLGGTLIFALFHASRLRPVTIDAPDSPNPLADTITFYYVFAFLLVLGLALVLAFLFRRKVREWRWQGRLADGALVACAVILALLVGLSVYFTNVSLVRADIFYKQGLSSEKGGQWDGAIYFYNKAIDITPGQDFYYLFLGRAYMEKGKSGPQGEREFWFTESKTALEEALSLSPLNTDHSANLGRLYRTWAIYRQGAEREELLQKSLEYYAQATSLSPHNSQLYNEWGQAYLALGDEQKALQKYEHSLDLDSEYVQTYLLLGEYHMSEGDLDRALETYERATEAAPRSADAHSSLAYVYSQMGNLDGALNAYRRAVELRPRDYTNRKNLAILYQQLGRTEDAIREGTRALELAPKREREAMETFLTQLGQPTSGMSAEDAQTMQRVLGEGLALMDDQDWAGAATAFEEVLTLDPYNVQAHSGLAYVYARQGRVDEAITENLVVLDLVPSDYNSHKNLALLYEKKGQLSKAIASIGKALALAPETEKAVLESYYESLNQMQGTTAEGSLPSAGDLQPKERNEMYSAPPAMELDPDKTYQATIVTEKGDIVVDLAATEAPQTVNNFRFLSQQGFYDGVTFHRVESSPGFSLIQGGDPTASGRGGPGYTVPAEIGLPHNEGAIATARLGDQVNPQRASSGSQFYICREPIHQLDSGYSVFGYVVEGLDVAKKIAVGDRILKVVISEK